MRVLRLNNTGHLPYLKLEIQHDSLSRRHLISAITPLVQEMLYDSVI